MSADPLAELQLATWGSYPPPEWPPGSPQAAVGAVVIVAPPGPPSVDAEGREVEP